MKISIPWGFTEKSNFYRVGGGGGGHKKPKYIYIYIYREDLPEEGGGLGQFADLKGVLLKKRGGIFEGRVDTPMHTIRWVDQGDSVKEC